MSLPFRALLVLTVLLFGLVGAGCSPPPKPPAILNLQLASVPATRPLADALAAEYAALGEYALLPVREGSTEDVLAMVASGRADVALLERPPKPVELLNPEDGRPRLRAWSLAVDHLALVVHPSNPIQELTMTQLSDIYAGLEFRWNGVGGPDVPIQLVGREQGATAREAFEAAILRGERMAGTAVVLPNDPAIADYVADHPAAIGYLSSAWARDGVKALAIEGLLPAEAPAGTYPIAHPITLVTRWGPPAKARAFARYCQSAPGQEVVGSLYAPLP